MTTKEKLIGEFINFVDVAQYVNETHSKSYIYDMYYEMLDKFGEEIALLAFIHKFEKTTKRGGVIYYVESNVSLEVSYNFDIFHKEIIEKIEKMSIDEKIRTEFADIISEIEIDVDFEEKVEMACSFCGGTGEAFDEWEEQYEICNECDGLGLYEVDNEYFMDCLNNEDLNDLYTRFKLIGKKLIDEINKNYV